MEKNPPAMNQKTAGILNRRRVMQLLRRHNQLSRRQLAQILNLKDATLSYLTAELMDRHLIRMAGKIGKHVMIEINPKLGWSLGIELAQGWITLNFVTAGGKSLKRIMLPFSKDLDTLADVISPQIDDFCSEFEYTRSEMLAIGVSMCGIVDTVSGVVLLSSYYQVKNYPLKERLTEAFGTIVEVDNSTNCAAYGEELCNNERDLKTFLHCDLLIRNDGNTKNLWAYGLSLFIEGSIYRGSHYAAGELTTFQAHGTPDAISLSDNDLKQLGNIDGELTPALNEVPAWLSARITPFASFMDPTHIIIGGDYNCCNKKLLAKLEEDVNNKLYQLTNRRIKVISSDLGDYGLSLYAAYTALNKYNEILFPLN